MFRIRRIHDFVLPINKEALVQVLEIFRSQFDGEPESAILSIPERGENPLKYRFQSMLYVADDGRGRVKGFALLLHAPDLKFCYLDYLAAASQRTGGGVGGALYESVRERARQLGSIGLFFECLPDSPDQCPNQDILKQNIARLRFYERYGARPIAETGYELPLRPGDIGMPYLVFDGLSSGRPLRRRTARGIVRAILERKYTDLCPKEYVDRVVSSFCHDPVKIREFRYIKQDTPCLQSSKVNLLENTAALVVTDRHELHHIHDRGYVESPVRIQSILVALERTSMFRRVPPRSHSESYIRAVHDRGFVDYFKKCCSKLKPGASVYPYVFPLRNKTRPPVELAVRAGYYCMDTFTPIHTNAFRAAKRAVDCALTAADLLVAGERVAYALVRPPGHHAEREAFGGFCYFNSSAIAAQKLSAIGRVAVLDIDYHHGNGTQDIFYDRPDVLTLSIHGHPRFAYPYFNGFDEETGEGAGAGFNINYALPESVDGEAYRRTLEKALKKINRFAPQFLVVALGLDPAKGDPTGTWSLSASDFQRNGEMIGGLHLPTLVVQEGGYRTRSLPANARGFFTGLLHGMQSNGTVRTPGARGRNASNAGRKNNVKHST